MRIRIDGTSIKPNHSAGVETFTYGLVRGWAAATDHRIEVEILGDTLAGWTSQIPDDRVHWVQRRVALRSDRLLGSSLRRYAPTTILESRLARRVVNHVRGRACPVVPGADVTLYPFSGVPVAADPAIYVLHDLRRFQPGYRRSGYHDIVRENVAKAAAVVVSWPHPYEQALRAFPAARDKIVMIPLPTFNAKPTGVSAAPEENLLLYPSSTAAHKNHATLLSALAMVPRFRLVCPGPLVEPNATRLRKRASRPDLADRVTFPGFVTPGELADLYRRASAVVVPSTWEAASGAIFEAFSWGLPVACADVPPLRAQVEYAGGDAAFFDPADAGSLASAVERLTAERAYYAAASTRGGHRLAARTWVDAAADYARVAEWIVAGRPGPITRSAFGAPGNPASPVAAS